MGVQEKKSIILMSILAILLVVEVVLLIVWLNIEDSKGRNMLMGLINVCTIILVGLVFISMDSDVYLDFKLLIR